MPQKKVVLVFSKGSISTLTYDNFNWEEFVAELEKQGLQITKDQEIPCG